MGTGIDQPTSRPDQRVRLITAWADVADLVTGPDRMIPREHIASLVAHRGRGTPTYPPVALTVFAWDDDHGTDWDAANGAVLSEIYFGVHHESGPDGGRTWVEIGEPWDPDQDEDPARADDRAAVELCGLVVRLGELNEHPIIDDEIHRRYLDELGERAWASWLREQVWDELRDALPDGQDAATAPLSADLAGDRRTRAALIRDAYAAGGIWWCAESAVTVINSAHRACVDHVLSAVFAVSRVPH